MERTRPVNLRISDEGLELIGESEGWVGYCYDDADPKKVKTFVTPANAVQLENGRWTGPYGGTLTKGYGHTRTTKPGDKIDRAEGLSLLRSDVREAESCVHRYVNVLLTQGEFDAMVDLFFNIGPGRMKGSNGPNDPGKDGIYCLGKTGGGRPSTLLTMLNNCKNDIDYEHVADCFTQWRMPGSIFEWGLLIRRIKFMLRFLGLPLVRAMNEMPNAMPADALRYQLVQKCKQLAREEAEDTLAMQTPAEELIKQTPPAAAPEASTEAKEGGAASPQPTPSPSSPAEQVQQRSVESPVAAGPAPQDPPILPLPGEGKPVAPATIPAPQSSGGAEKAAEAKPAAPRPAPLPPILEKTGYPPVIAGQDDAKPIHRETKFPDGVPYGIDPTAGAKPLESTERFVGAAMMWVANILRVGSANGLKLTGPLGMAGVVFLEMMKTPATAAIMLATFVAIICGFFWICGFALDKAGLRKKKRGERHASQMMY